MFLVNWEKCLLTSNSIFMNVSLIGKSFSFQILGQISDFSHLSFFLIAIFMLTIFGQHFIKTFSFFAFFSISFYNISGNCSCENIVFLFSTLWKDCYRFKTFSSFFLLYLVLSQFSEHWLVLFQYISSDDYLWLFALFKVFLFRKYSFSTPCLLVCWFVGLFKF